MDEIIAQFPFISSTQKAQFSELDSLYRHWNEKINIISRRDIDALYERHVLHALGIAKVINFKKDSSILDIGTGGGFPGIPLAILFPEVSFLLVDAIGKKIKVVNQIVSALKLGNVKTLHSRAENIEGTFDFVVSRAVTNMSDFVPICKGKIAAKQNHTLKNGILYLKGGDLTEELKLFKNAKEFLLSDYFKTAFFETKKVVHLPIKKRIKS